MKILLNMIVFIFFISWNIKAQDKTLIKDILDAVEHSEMDSTTVFVPGMREKLGIPNLNFNKEEVEIYPVYVVDYDSVNKLELKNNPDRTIALVPRHQRGGFKIYISDNDKRVKLPKRHVSSYNAEISFLYNKMFQMAKRVGMMDSNMIFGYFAKSDKLETTLKPVLINRKKGLYLTDQNVVYKDIESAIDDYFGSLGRYYQWKEDRASAPVLGNSYEKAREVVMNNYMDHIKFCPLDTLGNLQVLFKEIGTVTGEELNTDEKRLLTEKVLEWVRLFPPDKARIFTVFGIQFYNTDISGQLAAVLTKDKLYRYIDHRYKHGRYNTAASNYLFHDFLKKEGRVKKEYIADFNSYMRELLCD